MGEVVELPQTAEQKIVAECRAKFPDARIELVSVQTRVGLFVLRSPSMIEHRAFLQSLRDDAMRGEATRNLFATICVYPSPTEAAALLDRFGGVLSHPKVQNAIAWLTGQADDLLGKAWPAP